MGKSTGLCVAGHEERASEGDSPGRVLWWPHEVRLCRGGAGEGWGQWDNPLTVIHPAHLVSKCVLVASDLGAPVGKV